ncbi:MAG: transcription antitermination protein NusB [Prevotellaceae bacterium]|jgi:N utilization substance protein B|nr:transcription antitermination protein NusB [Prevotellaceae bacterium]
MLSRRLLRIKTLKEVFGQLMLPTPSPDVAVKNMDTSIQKTYDLYHLLLLLAPELADHAALLIEQHRNRNLPSAEDLNPNTKLVDNALIALLRNNRPLADYCGKRFLSWADHREVPRQVLAAMTEADFYLSYMASPTRSFAEDKALLVSLYGSLLEDFEPLTSALEDQNLLWADEVEFVLSHVLRTLHAFSKSQRNDAPLLPLLTGEADAIFGHRLVRRAVACSGEYRKLVEKFSLNWDVERIAYMDIVLMVIALAEMVEFDDIPIKVSLNEYIEIAKYYSTPSSCMFINGVLDRIVFHLKDTALAGKQQQICKS